MAISFVNVGTAFNAPAGTSTSLTPGAPAASVLNDLWIFGLTSNNQIDPTFSTTGWTKLAEVLNSTTIQGKIFAKYAAAGEAAPTVTVTSGRHSCQIAAYRGVDLATAEDVAEVTSSTLLDPLAITPITLGAVVLGFGFGRTTTNGQTHVFTSANGTIRFSTSMVSTGINTGLGMTEMAAWTTGAVDPALADAIAITQPMSISIALRPAGAGAAPARPPSFNSPYMGRW